LAFTAREHHFTGYGQVSPTLNLLTWLGARTRRLRLGTAVIALPWHNPVLLAEQAATLDLLSRGRLDFGIGKGYRYNEFAGFRVPMEGADARFEECLDLLCDWTFRRGIFKMDVVGIIVGWVIGSFAIGVYSLFWLIKNFRLRYNAQLMKRMLPYGLPLSPAAFLMLVLNGFDRYFLKELTPIRK
jgi:hypothetical protein